LRYRTKADRKASYTKNILRHPLELLNRILNRSIEPRLMLKGENYQYYREVV
jgi:hypothetical protein